MSVDWDSVEQFTSDQPMVVTTVDKKTVTGTVKSEGPDSVVTTTQGGQTIAKSDIAGIRSLADHVPPLAGWGRPPAFPEYLFFATIETVATSVIIWRAWTWSGVEKSQLR